MIEMRVFVIADVSVVFMWSAGDYGILEDSMGFELSFSDENICNATRTVTGWNSDHHCADYRPYYGIVSEFK